MRWQIKAVLDSIKALLPFQDRLRRIKRKYFPYQTEPVRDAWTLEQGIQQVLWLRESGFQLRNSVVMEIGTGWQPIIPLIYLLAGSERIYLTDTAVLLDRRLVLNAIDIVLASSSLISDRLSLSPGEIEARLSVDRSANLDTLLERLRMTYLAPYDTRHFQLAEASIDLVFSRAVFEHIPEVTLAAILSESSRLLRPTGMMFHIVDTSDHWEHNDKRISRVNFLRYPDWLFNLTCFNPLNYQNRLRHLDYVRLLENAGFEIVREENEVDPKSLEELKSLKVAAQFERLPKEELAIITTCLLAKRGRSRPVLNSELHQVNQLRHHLTC